MCVCGVSVCVWAVCEYVCVCVVCLCVCGVWCVCVCVWGVCESVCGVCGVSVCVCVCVCVSAFITLLTHVSLIHSYELWRRLSVSNCTLTRCYSSQHEYNLSLRIHSAARYDITVTRVFKMTLQAIKTKIFYTFIVICRRRRKRITFLRCTGCCKIMPTSCLVTFYYR